VAALTLTLIPSALFLGSGVTRLVAAFENAAYRGALLLNGVFSANDVMVVMMRMAGSSCVATAASESADRTSYSRRSSRSWPAPRRRRLERPPRQLAGEEGEETASVAQRRGISQAGRRDKAGVNRRGVTRRGACTLSLDWASPTTRAAILTDEPDRDVAYLEARHRGHARVEDRIRTGKDYYGMEKLPFRDYAHERRPACAVAISRDLIAWTQSLALTATVNVTS
jgi:hypothetical protein